ncbi:copper resistance CopC family protein [Agromyces sp. SYSU T00194]|uniref:copper resistance CopC family protein n=1 Tax=Agromyces chitinivorans TaxID=3158560 RepID=UPI003399515E
MGGEQTERREPRDARGSRFRMSAARRVLPPLAAAVGLLVATGIAALVPSTPAWAHAFLIGTTPADGATVDRVPQVALDFDEDLIDFGPDVDPSSVLVTDAAGLHYETACATTTGARITVPVALGESGAYTASWRSVTIEGHVIRGTVDFTYERPEFDVAAEGAAEPRCAVTGAVGGGDAGAAGALGIVGLVASAVVALGVSVTLLVARRRGARRPRGRGRHAAPPMPAGARDPGADEPFAHDKLERS